MRHIVATVRPCSRVLSTTSTVATRIVATAGIRLISRAEAKCGAVMVGSFGLSRDKVKSSRFFVAGYFLVVMRMTPLAPSGP